jgi:hypothetical protein
LDKHKSKKYTLNGAAGQIFGEIIAKFSWNENPENVQKMAPHAKFLTPTTKIYERFSNPGPPTRRALGCSPLSP